MMPEAGDIVVRIPNALWDDSAFRALTRCAQRMFLLVLTQPELDRSGVLPLRPRRWAGYARDSTVEQVLADLRELDRAGFIHLDEDDEEVWILRYIRPGMRLRIGGASKSRPRPTPAQLRAIRLAVYVRDGYACRHCSLLFVAPPGYDGDRALVATILADGDLREVYLELDHVHPYSLGGPFEVDNLQALCSPCNNRKGARTDAESGR